MPSRSTTLFRHALGAAAFSVALLVSAPHGQAQQTAQAASGPFAGMAGDWSGSGTLTAGSGNERIRCRASYVVEGSGNDMRQNLRCASDSYKLEVRSEVEYDPKAGVIVGRWTETTRNVAGAVSGRVSGGTMRVSVDGQGFQADMSVVTRGKEQLVTIKPKGTDVTEVSIKLDR